MVGMATTPPPFLTEAAVDLYALLGEQLASSTHVRSMTMLVREGPWDPAVIPPARRTPLGVLVIDGVLARDLSVAGLEATELVGEGDVVDPWTAAPPDGFLPASAHWTVLSGGHILTLDPALMHEAAQRPAILGALYAGAARRAARLALHQAIAQLPRVELRLLALLWHLAGRWGRVGPEGVVVPLPFSHARLGRLVGARRPTVTLALRELGDRGHVSRRADGSWQLGSSTPEMLADESGAPARRRRTRSKDGQDPIDAMATELRKHMRAAHERAQAQQTALPDNLSRLADARKRSEALRRESARLRAEVDALRRDWSAARPDDDQAPSDGTVPSPPDPSSSSMSRTAPTSVSTGPRSGR
jgi:CRP/FNR family cyclic AMP-dependent transcriptional regulator